MTSSSIDKEFGHYSSDEDNDLIISNRSSSLEVEDDSSFRPIQLQPAKKSVLYYLATMYAFLIIYRTEVLLSSALAVSVSIGVSEFVRMHSPKKRVRAR